MSKSDSTRRSIIFAIIGLAFCVASLLMSYDFIHSAHSNLLSGILMSIGFLFAALYVIERTNNLPNSSAKRKCRIMALLGLSCLLVSFLLKWYVLQNEISIIADIVRLLGFACILAFSLTESSNKE